MKTNRLLFIIVFQFLCFYSFSQVVIKGQQTIGGNDYDQFRNMSLTRDGGLIVCGNSYSGASGEKTDDLPGGWIVKLNARGDIQWNTTLDYYYEADIASIEQTNDKGYIICGWTWQYDYYDEPDISKLDSLGKVQWGKGYEYLSYYSGIKIHQIANGNYIFIIVGDYNGGGIINLLDSSGKQFNSINIPKQMGSLNSFYPTCAAKTNDNGLIVGGYSSISKLHSSYDYWITKIDGKGNISWQKVFGGNDDDECTAIEQLNDGSYVAGGYSISNASGNKSENNKGGYDYWLVQLDSVGNIMGDKTIGGAGNDYLHALQKTSDGGFIAGGTSSSDASGDKTEQSKGGSDYWVLKIKDMQIHWDKTIGGDTTDELSSIKEVGANDYVLGGSSLSGISGDKTQACRGNFDYWLVEINTTDNLIAHNSDKQIKSSLFNDKNFRVYPNPVSSLLHVEITGISSITLKDQSGRLVLTKTINGNDVINTSALPAGVYYVTNNNTGDVKKVVISR
jgi:hypothetical protein